MTDMLVRLYDVADAIAPDGVSVRRALTPEKALILRWIRERFSATWVAECEGAFALRPVACVVALRGQELLGFGVYDSMALGVMGPFGVDEAQRGSGVGRALCVAVAREMSAKGYQYAAIGQVGPKEFYERALGAVEIAGSEPGMYRGMLHV
jgi:hypothetical protein